MRTTQASAELAFHGQRQGRRAVSNEPPPFVAVGNNDDDGTATDTAVGSLPGGVSRTKPIPIQGVPLGRSLSELEFLKAQADYRESRMLRRIANGKQHRHSAGDRSLKNHDGTLNQSFPAIRLMPRRGLHPADSSWLFRHGIDDDDDESHRGSTALPHRERVLRSVQAASDLVHRDLYSEGASVFRTPDINDRSYCGTAAVVPDSDENGDGFDEEGTCSDGMDDEPIFNLEL